MRTESWKRVNERKQERKNTDFLKSQFLNS